MKRMRGMVIILGILFMRVQYMSCVVYDADNINKFPSPLIFDIFHPKFMNKLGTVGVLSECGVMAVLYCSDNAGPVVFVDYQCLEAIRELCRKIFANKRRRFRPKRH